MLPHQDGRRSASTGNRGKNAPADLAILAICRILSQPLNGFARWPSAHCPSGAQSGEMLSTILLCVCTQSRLGSVRAGLRGFDYVMDERVLALTQELLQLGDAALRSVQVRF